MLSAAAMCSCTAEYLDAPETNGSCDAQLVINLAVPTTSQEESADTRAEMNVSGPEGKINDLTLLAFGYDGGTRVVNRPLTMPSDLTLGEGNTARYSINELKPGKYAIYILANTGQQLNGISSEDELRKFILNWKERMPQAGNLPMVYEAGVLQEIDKEAGQGIIIDCAMAIAAVKVKYNIIFDPTTFSAEAFGAAGLKLKNLTVTNAAEQSYLIQNLTRTDLPVRNFTTVPLYYTDYTETPGNASADNKDVVQVSDQGSEKPAVYNSRWIAQGTIYMPERYAESSATPTTLEIDAALTTATGNEGNVRTHYQINLARHEEDPSAVSMPRDTYYEVIAKVKSLGQAELDASVTARSWSQSLVDADFIHTTLQLDKTRAAVTSLEEAQIAWATDGRGGVGFSCATTIDGRPVIKASVNQNAGTLTLSVNPEVPVKTLSADQAKGTANCYVTAGNIRKLIKVDYDISPFFIITPLDTKVEWSESSVEIRKKEYSYKTNLGGLLVTARDNFNTHYVDASTKSKVSIVGSSQLKIECASPAAAMGTMTVTAISDPVTTSIHYFDAYPADAATTQSLKSMIQKLSVTVMPKRGPYRIYFRAINDWGLYEGGETNMTGEWLQGQNSVTSSLYPVEYYGTGIQNDNWIDYWYCANSNDKSAWGNAGSNNRSPHTASHRIYIWSQEGETLTQDMTAKVWGYTAAYTNAPAMTADSNNPGWYYYNLPFDKKQEWVANGATGDRIVEPGTTLMIFNNHTNADLGYALHRATHHLDPGIPLFDYEDREGWILYDPTREPYYTIRDEKPIIEDVIYTIWTDVKPSGWFIDYGVAENKPSLTGAVKQFRLWSNNVSSAVQENGKWKYTIRLKAPRGDYAKSIRISFGGTTVTNPQRVYYYCRKGNGWTNPKVYIYKTGSENTTWAAAPTMKVDNSRSDSNGTYYYYDVPASFANGQVIFRNSAGSEQYPASNQPGLNLEGKTKIYYSDSKDWTDLSGYNQGTILTGGESYVLFGGRQFAGNTGYFNSSTKTWKAGKP